MAVSSFVGRAEALGRSRIAERGLMPVGEEEEEVDFGICCCCGGLGEVVVVEGDGDGDGDCNCAPAGRGVGGVRAASVSLRRA
jgi:hypothetical protein